MKEGQPIILIVNDRYKLTRLSSVLSRLTDQHGFAAIRQPTLVKLLKRILKEEGVAADLDSIERIAARDRRRLTAPTGSSCFAIDRLTRSLVRRVRMTPSITTPSTISSTCHGATGDASGPGTAAAMISGCMTASPSACRLSSET